MERNNIKATLDNLVEEFKQIDFATAARASGNRFDSERMKINFQYYGKEHSIDCLTGEINPPIDGGVDEPMMIINHFLRYKTYDGFPLTGKLASLKELHGGGDLFYIGFIPEAITPLAEAFGNDCQRIYQSIETMGAVKSAFGQASVTVKAFPYFPITLAVWEGEDDMKSSAVVLFDKSASVYAHIEDIIRLGRVAVERVIKACE